MKAIDLMIGDWVYGTRIKTNVKVVAMDSERQLQDIIGSVRVLSDDNSFGTWAQYLEPIPLSAEILEKNGFEKFGENAYLFRRCGGDGEIKIRLIYLTCGQWELYAMDYNKHSDTRISFSNEQSFLKVHELQHALKLCGIEKQIEL